VIKIAHLSDIHFGRIAHAQIVQDLVCKINEAACDLVIVSGDLTQRAHPWQFEAARDMLESFTAPLLVVAGNHDVPAWWHRPFARIGSPLRRYRKFISRDLNQSYRQNGLAVLGLNSAFGLTIKGGYVSRNAASQIEEFFGSSTDDGFKILAVHHHLKRIGALGRHDIAWNARRTFRAAIRSGIDLVLCGHLHISHIETVEGSNGEAPLVIASAGTATSDRGRKAHRDTNFFNLIEIETDRFRINEMCYSSSEGRFDLHRQSEYPRRQG